MCIRDSREGDRQGESRRTLAHRLAGLELEAEQVAHDRVAKDDEPLGLDRVNPLVERAVVRLAGVRGPRVAERAVVGQELRRLDPRGDLLLAAVVSTRVEGSSRLDNERGNARATRASRGTATRPRGAPGRRTPSRPTARPSGRPRACTPVHSRAVDPRRPQA